MDVRTTCFGEHETVQVADDALLTFPGGLPAFGDHTTFALIDDERISPFRWLQSLRDPRVGFLVVEPTLFVSDYEFELDDADVELLGLDESIQPTVLSILTVPADVRKMTANLRAPIVVGPGRIAKQVILSDERFPLRQPVYGEANRTEEQGRRAC